jgi:hypothetical protein
MNILLFSMPDSFEHTPTIAIRMPLAGAGITPERVYPFAVLLTDKAADASYDFVSLMQVKQNLYRLRDGHLLIAAMRFIHTLGLWN